MICRYFAGPHHGQVPQSRQQSGDMSTALALSSKLQLHFQILPTAAIYEQGLPAQIMES